MPHGCLSEATPGHTLDCLDRPRRQILYRHLHPGVSPPAKQPCYRGSIQRRECAGQVSRKTHPMIDREHLHREGYELLRGAIARPCELHRRPRPVKLKALAGAPRAWPAPAYPLLRGGRRAKGRSCRRAPAGHFPTCPRPFPYHHRPRPSRLPCLLPSTSMSCGKSTAPSCRFMFQLPVVDDLR